MNEDVVVAVYYAASRPYSQAIHASLNGNLQTGVVPNALSQFADTVGLHQSSQKKKLAASELSEMLNGERTWASILDLIFANGILGTPVDQLVPKSYRVFIRDAVEFLVQSSCFEQDIQMYAAYWSYKPSLTRRENLLHDALENVAKEFERDVTIVERAVIAVAKGLDVYVGRFATEIKKYINPPSP